MAPHDAGQRGHYLDEENTELEGHNDSSGPFVVSSSEYAENRGTSVLGGVFLIINAALGAGLLNFPEAYAKAGGVGVAMGIQVGLLFFIGASLLILAWCSDCGGFVSTYQDVMRICGIHWQRAASICVILYCYGTCVTFLIIIGDQSDRGLSVLAHNASLSGALEFLSSVFVSIWGLDFCRYWYMKREFIIVVTSFLFILPLCFPKRIAFLKYASFFGVFAIFYLNCIIAYKYFSGNFVPGEIVTRPKVWTDVFAVVPVICFGYQCHVSCVPIYSCLEKRSLGTFVKSVILALGICAITYSIAGVLGYLMFGASVPSDILEAFDAHEPLVLIGIISLALKMYTTYPILLFCGREAVNQLFLECRRFQHPTQSARGEKTRRISIASVWFATTLIVAVVVPTITTVIDFLGSLAAIFIFFFPGVCLLKLTLQDSDMQRDQLRRKTLAQLVLGTASVGLGVLLFMLVLLQTIMDRFIHGDGESAVCEEMAPKKAARKAIFKVKQVIQKKEAGGKVTEIAREYGVGHSTISNILVQKDKIMQSCVAKEVTRISGRISLLEEMEKLLAIWISERELKRDGCKGEASDGHGLVEAIVQIAKEIHMEVEESDIEEQKGELSTEELQ
ncbi:unnamed protein product, partial [Notodromas monacha]